MPADPLMPSESPAAMPRGAATDTAPALWNPRVAACWSFFLTAAFGAYLHMKNWEALGRPEEAAKARKWLLATAVLWLGMAAPVALTPYDTTLEAWQRLTRLLTLLLWYFFGGRPQVEYVAQHVGRAYPRRAWLKPVLCAVLCILGALGCIGALAHMLGNEI